MAKLTEQQIASAVYYPIPLHRQDVFAQQCQNLSLPVAESIATRCMSLPVYPEMTNEQVDQVIEAVREALK
jgi:dTDP-4-amino-4,6-dideoxygalactose transaminase